LTAAGRRSVNAGPSSVPAPRPWQSPATVTAMPAVAGSSGTAGDGRPRPAPPRPLAAAV